MQKGRYSKYIRPISIFTDLFLIIVLIPFFYKGLNINFIFFGIYLAFIWIIISFFSRFYEVYRFTTPVEILTKIAKQSVIFILLIIAYFPFNKEFVFSGKAIALYSISLFSVIILIKSLFFYYLKKYRIVTGNNFRNAIIIGYTNEALDLKKIFDERPDYGYRFKGFFSDKKVNENIEGKIASIKAYCIENKIDEIYCSLNEISDEKLKDLVEFGDNNSIVVKFIPDSKAIFSKNLKIDYYELFPVLSLQKTALHDPLIKNFKRGFDFIFSLFVIILVLSWLTPLMALLIKLESRGPVFFKQSRPGLDEQEFLCYKFRSMQVNVTTEKEASRNDPRVTRIGRFIRKTSIDELPQFFNVLLGDMSVVGPRPHLWSQNKNYGNRIKKYMVRHYVKPGITGLAQVKGCRGEIETDNDMINRIKYDVYYIENWSLLMDIKIIIQTVVNIFKGEEKAY
ncbi:MAG: undecaprenyl-phosphate glucose phosphotransferase [Flavobacterium sp.]|jgi:putative colanic acid biosynthesis UDP-glucose lipid carrier transferase|uniref:undecaprenyl-phosphate glucose phosphotransferase n=1 Tax=Flavobacterium sp. TaxID=239 RepID=UPI0025BF5BEF|nr:undecaprenyl-phosphate glucose phosphotransferase [Flavobacterium sp.]MCA1965418.1 undecaprenyl-phosphate glucose phosphotransferase [Flavobacterium sp.]